MNKKIIFVVAMILSSISAGYSLDTSKTVVHHDNIENTEIELDPNIVAEIIENNDSLKPKVITTQKQSFSIEYKGADVLFDHLSAFFKLNQEND